jgi:GT2 family glycosyltransferase
VGLATIVVVADDRPVEVERALAALREHAPDGTQLVVVGNAPTPGQAAALEELEAVDPGSPGIGTEVVWTSERLGHAAALNAGIRRAEAPVVVVLDPAVVVPTGDVVTPLAEALAVASVAVVGLWGLAFDDVAEDFRRLVERAGDVVAIDGALLAFRRADYAARGPLDEAFREPAWLDVWWNLVLREAAGAGEHHRRAVALEAVPARRTGERPAGDARLAKRNYYRFLERFRGRESEFQAHPPDVAGEAT